MPKISVIVPVYNTEQYLPRCIDSILAQTFTDFELLLIDDGSKDGSDKICDEYSAKDSRIRVFHKENGGVSSARNLGLDNARGEWIIFVDSDDWIEYNCINSCTSITQDYPLVDIIRYGYYEEKISEPSQIILCKENGLVSSITSFFEMCDIYCYWGFIWNTVFRKELIGELRFDEDICYCEDHIFTYKYMTKCRSMFFVSLPLYHYQTFSDGLSRIKDAHIILSAAEKEFIIVSQIIGIEKAAKSLYNKIKYAITITYKYEKEYRKRKELNNEIIGYSQVFRHNDLLLLLYENKFIPFFIKDFLLRRKESLE